MGELAGRREVHGAARRFEGTIHGIRAGVISVSELGAIEPGEHGPALSVIGRQLYGMFQGGDAGEMFFGSDVLMESEATEQGFVGRERGGITAAEGFGHAVGENALSVSDGGDEAGHDVV